MQHRLSVLLITALLCPISWVYGGTKKQSRTLARSVPAVSVQQERDQQQAELTALDAGARSPWAGDDRQQAQALFACLNQRGIAIKSTFYKMLGQAPMAQRSKLVSLCQAFFDSVDTKEISNTGCLTSMIHNKAHVSAFLLHSDDTVKRVAKTPALSSLTSLFNNRGFPRAKENTQTFMEWDLWWRGEGQARVLDRKLLCTFSSMFSGKGLPEKQVVEDYLGLDVWWQGEGQARALDRELLRVFSSMFSGRGLPDKKAVEEYLQLDVWWQGEGQARTLDRVLLRAFSSMFHSRGLPDKKAIEDYLQLGIWWQEKDTGRTLDRELLRFFSSMFHCRGLPDQKAIEDYLQLDIWWQEKDTGRTLDRELLRAFSSMFHGRGLPDSKAVEDYLRLDIWWQGEGQARALDRELLRAFSSMFNSKGLPDKKAIEGYLQLDVWWQEDNKVRTLDRELLRAFSSMFSGRGLPDKKAVEDYLGLDVWWQGEGKARTLDRELLRAFSSMFSSRGLPDKKAVEEYLQLDIWWQQDGEARTLDRELLRVFSSMFNSRGLPDKKVVEDYLRLNVWWQGEGKVRTLDRELLRAFSSMFRGRGLPDKKAVEDYLGLDIWWQGDGKVPTLDRALLRAFSSMFNGRGFPNKKAVEDYLQLDVWWRQDGGARTLDRELLRAFSSMFCGRGLPDKKAVEDYLRLDVWWQGEDKARALDRELLRAFSSMFHGRGFPNKKAVEDYLQLDVWWQQEGGARTLDRELLRVFSSMFNGRGLPDKTAVKDYLGLDIWWQGADKGGKLDRELLRTFSSMFHGRGLPDKKVVEDYLQLDVWWQEEGKGRILDRDLLRAFSSMFNGRGLPDKKAVEEYLQWEIWQLGEGNACTLDRNLLHAFASMFNGKGLPDKLRTNGVMQWLSEKEQWSRSAIKVMARLYSGAYAGHKSLGLPDINKLRQAEQKLTALISAEKHDQEEDEEDDELLPLIKIVALYLANDGGTRQLSWTDCEAFLQEYGGCLAKKDVFRHLLLTLHHHGGRGVKEVMALISEKTAASKRFVLHALGRGYSLAAVQYALEMIEPSEWWEYLFFTKELRPVPDRQQWQTIKGYLKALALVWSNQECQRRFLTLIWPLSPEDRERFVQPDPLRELSTLLPSVQVMRQFSKSLTTAELRTLFDTCLTYRAGQPDKQGLPILFKALLLAQLPLFGHGAIPPGILAQTHDQPEGVVIGVNPTIGIKDSVTLFTQVMAVIMGEFWDCEYTINGPTLTLWPHGSTDPITLPTPDLQWYSDGVQIRHWTSADLHRFSQATESWSGFYREPPESNEPEPDVIEARLAKRHRNRTADVEPQGERSVPYLSVAMLRGIVKNRVHMNRIAWASADYHKDTLPPSLLAQLKERANADNDGLVPDSLKTFLSEREQQSQIAATDPDLRVPNSSATWLETVLRQSVLSEADINQLYTYRDQLTSDQVVDILFRMDQRVSQDTMQRWYSLLGDKHQQTLKTDPPWLDGSDQTMEAVHDVEDILRDLFPDALLSMP